MLSFQTQHSAQRSVCAPLVVGVLNVAFLYTIKPMCVSPLSDGRVSGSASALCAELISIQLSIPSAQHFLKTAQKVSASARADQHKLNQFSTAVSSAQMLSAPIPTSTTHSQRQHQRQQHQQQQQQLKKPQWPLRWNSNKSGAFWKRDGAHKPNFQWPIPLSLSCNFP